MKPLIVPSLLAADFMNLQRDIRILEEAGAGILHLDVMDGHFVPNLTFGSPVIKAIRDTTKLELDVHLMIENAEETFLDYIGKDGKRINYLTVHYEAVTHLDQLLTEIGREGVKPGVALNPHTPVGVVESILSKCHHVLIMTVNPGFGGQEFIEESCQRIRHLKSLIETQEREVIIEVDGGIGLENVGRVVEAGAGLLVSGSSVFKDGQAQARFRALQEMAQKTGAMP